MPDLTSSSSRQLIIATAGHVDHGKTSLVRQLTGVETDTLQEEKSRGLTINLGYAYHHFADAETGESLCLGFVDVPGHIDFIQNMLAGVGGVEHALLVVAADDGIMPQTIEHLQILDLLGIHQLAIALSKIDRVDEQRVQEVKENLSALLAERNLAAEFFPVDNVSGAGIDALRTHLEGLLGNTAADATDLPGQKTRFLIDRSFKVKGIGTVVTGSVRSGSLAVDDRLVLSATGEEARIRGMRLDNREVNTAQAGQRAALNITLAEDSIKRGDWLLARDRRTAQNRIDVELSLTNPDESLKTGAQYHLYMGAAHHIVTVRPLDAAKKIFQLRSDDNLYCVHGDRFVLRDPAGSRTLGGGRVLDINVPRRGRSSESRIAFVDALKAPIDDALPQLLDSAAFGLDPDALADNYNLPTEIMDSKIAGLDGVVLPLPQTRSRVLLGSRFYDDYARAILSHLDAFHQRQPHVRGLSEPALSKELDFAGSHLLFHSLLEKLIADGAITRSGTLLHLPDHQAVLSQEEKDFLEKIRPILLKSGNIPPRTRELVEMTGIPLRPLERILKQTTQSGNLVKVADNRYFLPETIMELAAFTESLTGDEDSGFSVIQFRDASGIGRNLCIEILEYFDRIGFTRRDDNTRFLRTSKENIFKQV
ncbi:MAG: selenocysteine-specific translation elongation factor [Proteobacteria bacterium]|nr:selenocysteine-specific translation elongation factor [Pseudomonadota bacterium]MDA0926797.1 selenocysteine-specific translation elongation factor [Pseudomonadota bacterium]